jgi:hypothetical protein
MDHKAFNLERVEFTDVKLEGIPWLIRAYYSILWKVTGLVRWRSAVTLKEAKVYKTPSLKLLGEAIRLDDLATLKVLCFHQHRFDLHRSVIAIIYLCIALLGFSFFGFLVLRWLLPLLRLAFTAVRWWGTVGVMLLVTSTTLLYSSVIAGVSIRLASALSGRYFAETHCIRAILNLILLLSRDDALTRPDRKKAVVSCMSELAQNTLLLSRCYASKDRANQNWLEKHFKHMARYIWERQRWAIAPKETTLADLRQDFYRLAPIYITGNYGDSSWPDEAPTPDVPTPTWVQRLLTGLHSFVGVVLPLIILGLFLWQPTLLKPLSIEPKVVTLVIIAWLLLAIDAVLELGIVAGIADLAKGIKELT